MGTIEAQILAFINEVYNSIGWTGVVVLMAIESACIPLPSEVIMPLAGWMLVRENELGLSSVVLAGVFGALGCVVGSLVAYVVGAWGGRPLVERYGRYVLISPHDLQRADAWFARYGDWAVFFSRLLPVVRTFISFPAGIARTNLPRFIVLTFLGSLPWTVALAYAGYVLGEHWETIREVMRPFDIPIILFFVVLVAIYVYRHLRKSQSISLD